LYQTKIEPVFGNYVSNCGVRTLALSDAGFMMVLSIHLLGHRPHHSTGSENAIVCLVLGGGSMIVH